MLEHVSVGGGPATRPFCEQSAELVRSLLPSIEQLGLATAAEVEIDTLAERLERDTALYRPS